MSLELLGLNKYCKSEFCEVYISTFLDEHRFTRLERQQFTSEFLDGDLTFQDATRLGSLKFLDCGQVSCIPRNNDPTLPEGDNSAARRIHAEFNSAS